MSSITDVSGNLAEYMLRGWVLTDVSCPTPGCAVPLMRSPAGRSPVTHFCANCDGSPNSNQSVKPTPLTIPDSSPSISSSSHISRSSTPPTEVSSTLSSPTFAAPVDTEESIRRRQQSDRASSEIGKRLLKGWAMLADECPNVRCYGVPLIRPPKAGGSKDPRKECVICGSVYLTEADAAGWERLVHVDAGGRDTGTTSSSAAPVPNAPSSRNKGKAAAHDQTPQASRHVLPLSDVLSTSDISKPISLSEVVNPTVQVSSTTASTLEFSAKALESTLRSLSERLTSLSGGQIMVDTSSIALTADAITKVAQALSQVKQLQRSNF